MNSEIDVVIPWVDSSDPKWIAEKNKYSKNVDNSEGTNDARFRDWNQLRYVLRSIETNMPWVHKIYLLTANQIPEWLNENSNKIKVVFHKEFIPKKYLPTFSSHTIELNMHHIPDLKEKFIYFNDDYFVLNPMKPTDFFVDDLPCDNGILHVHCPKKSLMIHTITHNDAGVINEHFVMKDVLRSNFKGWFNYKYGLKHIVWNIFLSICPRFPGFRQHHLASPFLKSTFEKVWEIEGKYLDEVCLNKFRTKNDVNQWLMREWQLASNKFHPYNKFKSGKLIDFEKKPYPEVLKECQSALKSKKLKMICINDGDIISDFENIKKEVEKMLEEKYHSKSSFEK